MNVLETKKRERLDMLRVGRPTPSKLGDTRYFVKNKICFDTARTTNKFVDTLLFFGLPDEAMEYAIAGERLMKLAIEKKEWPAALSRKTPQSALLWDQYEHLHGLSWMVVGREDESILKTAFAAANDYMEILGAEKRPRHLAEYTLGFAELAGKLGRFDYAIKALETLRKPVKKRKATNLKQTRKRLRKFCHDIWEELDDERLGTDERTRMKAFFDLLGLGSFVDQVSNPVGPLDKYWLSYMACKFVPKFELSEFTRGNVIEKIQFLLPEELDCVDQ